jgi:hypothetical protein
MHIFSKPGQSLRTNYCHRITPTLAQRARVGEGVQIKEKEGAGSREKGSGGKKLCQERCLVVKHTLLFLLLNTHHACKK